MSEVAVKELPEGWQCVPLKDAVHIILGQSPSSSTYNFEGEGLPFFQGKTEFGEIYPTVRKWCTEPKKIAEKEDVLVSVRAPVGPTNLAPYECAIGRGLASLRPLGGTDAKYFLYLIRRYQNNLAALGTGTTFEAISGDTLKNFIVPIAPPEQQKRIVAKIEELFSHIDAGIVALQKAKQLLKQYRQSVLKAAVTGELTKEWREANKDKLEPASELLKRILIERRQKWEAQQLEQFKAKGKMPKDDKWKGKYKEPAVVYIESLSALPDFWCLLNVELIAAITESALSSGPFGSNLGTKDYVKQGVPVIRGKNIQDSGIVLKGFVYVSEEKAKKIKRSTAKPGDVVIIAVGSSGRPAVVPSELPWSVLSQNCNKVTCDQTIVAPQFLSLFLSSIYGQFQISGKTTDTVRKFFSLTNFKAITIPIPNLVEQEVILDEVAKKYAASDRLELELNRKLIKSEKNKQSILASAFSGSLVAL